MRKTVFRNFCCSTYCNIFHRLDRTYLAVNYTFRDFYDLLCSFTLYSVRDKKALLQTDASMHVACRIILQKKYIYSAGNFHICQV